VCGAEAFEGISRVCYWPFALAGDRLTDTDRWIRESLLALGLEAEVDTWPKLAGHNAGELRKFDLLFVGGGLTSRLASKIAEMAGTTVSGNSSPAEVAIWEGRRCNPSVRRDHPRVAG
jgi:hypothetical protein